ncbi:immunoglobulin-like domain-containing protein [Bacillus cereus group sp. BfR-BA-01380]|uniref:immunoglobulin-like domain-containing protein n=1 Tax=Bacillus cereus group sp. BfR-BA-01380 TaxID=2920324 RepID=UPI001F55E19E|nr:immunoglobulin-like domain-containing protein [Bacillus cereus group sp. BfR-BA-01380]
MKNKKRRATVALITGLALTAVTPYGVSHAEETNQLQVQIQEDSFRTGELTQPSQKEPENVVKDALKEKTEQALSPKQVNGETGVDYKVIQKRGSYDGTTLMRMQQTYEGKEVYGHQLTAHVDKKGVVKSVSGDSAQNLKQEDLKKPINLSQEEAKQYIYTKYGNDIKFISEPEVKEVIFVDENNGQASNAYQVTFAAATPKYVSGTYLVNANNGEMLKNMVQESNLKASKKLVDTLKKSRKSNLTSLNSNLTSATGTGKDDLGISRTFGISKQSNGEYVLADYTRGQGIETYDVNYRDYNTEANYYPGTLATSASTTFNDPKAVSAHFLATKVYDFYKDKYKRNSFDNKGQKVVSVVHAWNSSDTNDPKDWQNAFSSGSMLVYGDPIVKAFDAAGHEFTHSVTSSESNLEYSGEAGAINEALSDIMGTAIEKYINNGKFNWTIAEQTGSIFRDMANPPSVLSSSRIPYPDDYSKFNDFNGRDNGGVHFNSSIINKAAYLIAKGGTHNGVTVEGIGEDKMFDIFYYANTDELNMTSNFSELRSACFRVATNKYGANSTEAQAVEKAFDAVKIKGTVKEPAENQAPELTVPSTTTLHVGDTFDPMRGVKAADKEDGDLTNRVKHKGNVDTSKPGKYIVEYSVVDSQGVNATATQTVIVEENGETPDMEPKLTVPAETTINVGDSFDPMAGVSATDKEDGDLTSKVTVDGKVDTSKAGTYALTYTVTDSKSHKVTAKQAVTVKDRVEVKDEQPVLTVPAETTINVGDSFDPMAGVSATDKEDGDLTSKVTVDGKVDTSKAGTYALTYTVTDSKSHKVTAKQAVTVKDRVEVKDEQPVLTVPAETTINVGDSFDPMAGVSATDKEDGDLTSKVTVDGKVDTSKAGTYVLTYTVTESKGNEVTTIQKVFVKDKDTNNGNGPDKDTNNGNGPDKDTNNGNGPDKDTNNGNGPDKDTNNGNGPDKDTNNSNASDTGNSNISKNSTSDKKEVTYKELPKTGASTNNSAAMGVLMVLAGIVLSFGRKFRKVLK